MKNLADIRTEINDRVNALAEEDLGDTALEDTAAFHRLRARDDLTYMVEKAYKVISQALNRGEQEMIAAVFLTEHPTLLGKLANCVLEAAAVQEHDGRLSVLNMTLGDIINKTGWDAETRFSEIRQPFI